MSIYKVKYGQTIFDIAVQEYGSISGVSQILSDNKDITLGTILNPNDEIIVTPNSTNIESIETYSYFKNRIITNTESTIESLDSSAYVGTISTTEINSLSFINSSIWGSDAELRFSNNEVVDSYSRVSMNNDISFNDDKDYFEIDITYRNGSSEQIVVGSTTGASIRIVDSKVRLYADGDVLLLESDIKVSESSNIKIRVESVLVVAGGGITKGILLFVNEQETFLADLGGNIINFNLLGGSTGTIGLDGTVGKIDINGSVFMLLEGSGIYIYKTVI